MEISANTYFSQRLKMATDEVVEDGFMFTSSDGLGSGWKTKQGSIQVINIDVFLTIAGRSLGKGDGKLPEEAIPAAQTLKGWVEREKKIVEIDVEAKKLRASNAVKKKAEEEKKKKETEEKYESPVKGNPDRPITEKYLIY